MTDAELLEEARELLTELQEEDSLDLHTTNGCVDEPEDFCSCPRVAKFKRIMRGWKPR